MGKMEVIFDKNTNISKEEFIVKALEELKEDMVRNDTKSIMYHSLALKEHKKHLKQLKDKTNDL